MSNQAESPSIRLLRVLALREPAQPLGALLPIPRAHAGPGVGATGEASYQVSTQFKLQAPTTHPHYYRVLLCRYLWTGQRIEKFYELLVKEVLNSGDIEKVDNKENKQKCQQV